MLRFLLLALATAAQAQVRISYEAPVLQLVLPDFDRQVASVVFEYGDADHAYLARGVQTSEGWAYRAEVRLGDRIYAQAAEYGQDGALLRSTDRAVFSTAETSAVLPPGRQIRAVTFRDDFDSFDRNSWNYEVSMFGGMNWEFQVYTPDAENVYTQGGSLYLRPTFTVDDPRFDESFLTTGTMDVASIWGYCTNNGNYGCTREGQYGMLPPIKSGKVKSIPTIRFGEIEVRARIPRGDWLWPAIWLMPRDGIYGGWPTSGEMDIMETRGNEGPLGVGTVSSTLHWGPAWDQNRWDLTHGEIQAPSGSWHDDYHVWRMEWTTSSIKTFIDNQQIMSVDAGSGFWDKGGFSGTNPWAGATTMAPFDQDFYIMFNTAVGGTNGYFSDNANWPTPKPWPNNSPHANQDFWTARPSWGPSWVGDQTALLIDYVEFRN